MYFLSVEITRSFLSAGYDPYVMGSPRKDGLECFNSLLGKKVHNEEVRCIALIEKLCMQLTLVAASNIRSATSFCESSFNGILSLGGIFAMCANRVFVSQVVVCLVCGDFKLNVPFTNLLIMGCCDISAYPGSSMMLLRALLVTQSDLYPTHD